MQYGKMTHKTLLFLTILIFINISIIYPTFAVQSTSSTQPVQVTVNPNVAIAATWNSGAKNSTINLGSMDPDGMQKTFNGGVTGEQLFTYSNVAIDVYTKASGPLSSGTDTIALTNFRYTGGSVTNPRSFTTKYYKMYPNWPKAPVGGPNSTDINLYLTIPFGTSPGTYSTTVYFSAVQTGKKAPKTP